ncbi:31572_t:CDS:2 [Gigaspora margarita]|uniref:31572_t:CDS:1 n=1 Tax=Gigaspora margarita TaxID=4874 RepID=A0ABN7UCZ7_GIGMA|nr:31572_t:CDS:2 [Gigaspora margarita]
MNMYNNFNGQYNEDYNKFINNYGFSINVHNNFNGQYNKDYDMKVNKISTYKFNTFNIQCSKNYDESMNDNRTSTDSSMESKDKDSESTYSLIENHVFQILGGN